jgi:hypothetical protein
MDERLGGPQSRSGRGNEEKKKIPAPVGNRTPVVQPVAQSLYWLSYSSSYSVIVLNIKLVDTVNADL